MSYRKYNLKKIVSKSVLKYIKDGMSVGIGSGSTVKEFIHLLYKSKINIKYVISSSINTTNLLNKYNFKIKSINSNFITDIYIDGADQADIKKNLIKGGGGALTREKICANSTKKFICIIDESKIVKSCFTYKIPIEIIKISKKYVERQINKIGGIVTERDIITDNKNIILDIKNTNQIIKLNKININELEKFINNITGVVSNGIFSINKPDLILFSQYNGKTKKI